MQNFLLLTLVGLTGFFSPLLDRLDSDPESRNNSSPGNTTSTERRKTTEDISAFSTKRFRYFGFNLGKNSDHSTATKLITRPSTTPHNTNGRNKSEGWYEFGKKHREKLHRGWKGLKDKFRLNKVNNSAHDSNKRGKFHENENTQKSTYEIRGKSVQDRTVSGTHQTRLNSAYTTEATKHKQTHIQTPSTHGAQRTRLGSAHPTEATKHEQTHIQTPSTHGVQQTRLGSAHPTEATKHEQIHIQTPSTHGAHQTRLDSAHTNETTKHEQTHSQTSSTHQAFNYSTVFKRKINLTAHGLRGEAQYEGSINFSLRYGRRGATVYQNKINLTAPTTHQTTHVTHEGPHAEQSSNRKTDEVHQTTHVTFTGKGFEHQHTDSQRKQTGVDHSTAKLHNKSNEDKHQITTRAPEPDKQTSQHETKTVPKVESAEVRRAKEKYSQAKKELENLISDKENKSLWTQGRFSELLKFQRLIDDKRREVQEKQTEWERLRKE